MTSLPPLFLEIYAKRWSCVLDVPLVLQPYGLLCALRLAEEMNVWLVRMLWEILDNTRYYSDHPESLYTGINDNSALQAEREVVVDSLAQWQQAREESGLASHRLFWLGDSTQESFFPNDVGADILERYEVLARSLDDKSKRTAKDKLDGGLYYDCVRDVIALSSALNRYRPLILTVTPSRTKNIVEPPSLCRQLHSLGIHCRHVTEEVSARPLKDALLTIFARTGVTELIWAGLNLAVVQVVTPHVQFYSPETTVDDHFYEGMSSFVDSSDTRYDYWKNAQAFWFSLS
jgi:hypothetical protein